MRMQRGNVAINADNAYQSPTYT